MATMTGSTSEVAVPDGKQMVHFIDCNVFWNCIPPSEQACNGQSFGSQEYLQDILVSRTSRYGLIKENCCIILPGYSVVF